MYIYLYICMVIFLYLHICMNPDFEIKSWGCGWGADQERRHEGEGKHQHRPPLPESIPCHVDLSAQRSTTPSTKVDLQHSINFRALCGDNLVA